MFKNQLKLIRKKHQMSQSELASRLNVKQSTIANYEKGVRVPNLESLIEIADLFNMSLDELTGRKVVPSDDLIKLSDAFLDYLMDDEWHKAENLAEKLRIKTDLKTVYFKLFRYALTKIGWLWEVGAITIAQEHQLSDQIASMISSMNVQGKKHLGYKHNGEKVLGMTIKGEKHLFGLKMLFSVLEIEGYEARFIGEAIPLEDLIQTINEQGFNKLIISISSRLHIPELKVLLKEVKGIDIIVVGCAANIIEHEASYTSYEACMEAILCQNKKLMKDNQS